MIGKDTLKTLAEGSSIIFLGIIFSKIFGYFYRLIIARIGVEQYGTLSLGIIIVGIIITLSTLGLDFGVLRYVSYFVGKKDHEKIKGIINSSLKISIPISIVFSLLLFIFSNKIALNIFNNPNLSLILKILSISIPFVVISRIFLSTILAFKKAKYYTYSQNITENLLKVLITLLLIILGYGIIGAAIAYIIAMGCVLIVSFYFLQRKIFPFLSKDFKGFFSNKTLLLFSLPLLFSSLIERIMLCADSIMIGIFKNSYFVGIYNSAFPTSMILFIIPLAISSLFVPILTSLYSKNNKDEMKETYKLTTRWIFVSNLPLFLLMVFFSKQILFILFGKEYIMGYSSLVILCIGYFIYSIFLINQQVLFVIKKPNLILINTIIAASLNIVLNYFLIQKYGIIGGAIATTTALIILSVLCLIESNIFIKLKFDLINIFKYIVAGIVSIVLIDILNKYVNISIHILELIILSIIFSLCYFGLIILMKGLNKEDLYVLSLIKNKLKNV